MAKINKAVYVIITNKGILSIVDGFDFAIDVFIRHIFEETGTHLIKPNVTEKLRFDGSFEIAVDDKPFAIRRFFVISK